VESATPTGSQPLADTPTSTLTSQSVDEFSINVDTASMPDDPSAGSTAISPGPTSSTLTHRPPIPLNVSTKSKSSWKTVIAVLPWPLIVTGLFIYIASVTLDSDNLSGPLANLQPRYGILMLSLLSKLIDYSFDWASRVVCEKWQWGRLLRARCSLLTFLVMSSDVGGWFAALFAPFSMEGKGSQSISHNTQRPLKRRFPLSSRICAFLRIFFWLCIQFPGIIIMALLDPQTSYAPTHWTSVSGGVGLYDGDLSMSIPLESSVLSMITSFQFDTKTSTTVEPVTEACALDSTCFATLLSGGIVTISPSLAIREGIDTSSERYMLRNVPSYQIESWSNSTIAWNSEDCKTYDGGLSSVLQICQRYDDATSILTAG
jgi:hypothetical protein